MRRRHLNLHSPAFQFIGYATLSVAVVAEITKLVVPQNSRDSLRPVRPEDIDEYLLPVDDSSFDLYKA